ncbi:PAS domain-containing sensor histidine kinase [Rubrivivax gelatinosus]|uniref:histidine kinase n=1 Tax=Rubrivivax gelatinosus TaxID=28068 RepID=A0ABS1DPP3_RUBGE|nr:ATP-binding protein [Rubrivivax gelatinosus]MBK1612869.1 PAS domain-containing sensor histidine kinase [Rubrivivax gelatinosus]MBK1711936.1 PAS domain-containing sensor histidine kinase [Rubrivivax gelatinosus]
MTDPDAPVRAPRLQRWLPWIALVTLLLVAQTLLVWLTLRHESSRAQEEADEIATEAAAEMKRDLLGLMRSLQALSWGDPPAERWRADAEQLLREQRLLLRVERRDPQLGVADAVDGPFAVPLFSEMPRVALDVDAGIACNAARHLAAPAFSRSYFVPGEGGIGQEVIDICIPLQRAGRDVGYLVGTVGLGQLLEAALGPRQARRHELSFVEGDGTRLARAGLVRGAGIYQAERLIDVPGAALQLRADSAAGRPSLIPNVATALVLGLSLALFAVVSLLARDVRRRARVERALGEALAFRKAMEDSLVTGLRARDLHGRITYVNPAFCAMVGFSEEEMRQPLPPYWPPEFVEVYAERQRARLVGAGRPAREAREGFETVFMRKSGERFPVMIYEAALVDGQGRQSGWMSTVLDVSAQRRIEEFSRQQQDRLQASARLATVGEMASLLSHELNQPLAAIASYASGSLNMLDDADGEGAPSRPVDALMRQALERIAEQAERAGRVIKSVHHFVRRRVQQRETLGADQLIDAVLPLVRLQARKSGTRIELDIPKRAPRLECDRTMLEQVLLNLTRNGIQAMETDTPLEDRVLALRVQQASPQRVEFVVADRGPGIAAEVAEQLFTPFYTTRSEGMGLGLSLCRTVVEQHGGTLEFGPGADGRGTEFRFTLPAARTPAGAAASSREAADG